MKAKIERLVIPARAVTALALALARGLADPLIIGVVPWLAAMLLAERLPAERAARLGGGGAALAARAGEVGGRSLIDLFGAPRDRAALAQAVAAVRASLAEAAFAAADAASRALAFDALLDELLAALGDGAAALAAPAPGAPHARPPGGLLSPREREVLALVAAGYTNKEIAEQLFIGPNTVKTHVTALLTKLDAANRAQLATIAARRGLLAD